MLLFHLPLVGFECPFFEKLLVGFHLSESLHESDTICQDVSCL